MRVSVCDGYSEYGSLRSQARGADKRFLEWVNLLAYMGLR